MGERTGIESMAETIRQRDALLKAVRALLATEEEVDTLMDDGWQERHDAVWADLESAVAACEGKGGAPMSTADARPFEPPAAVASAARPARDPCRRADGWPKRRYLTEAEAQKAVAHAARRRQFNKPPAGFYQCPACGFWHLSASPQWQGKGGGG